MNATKWLGSLLLLAAPSVASATTVTFDFEPDGGVTQTVDGFTITASAISPLARDISGLEPLNAAGGVNNFLFSTAGDGTVPIFTVTDSSGAPVLFELVSIDVSNNNPFSEGGPPPNAIEVQGFTGGVIDGDGNFSGDLVFEDQILSASFGGTDQFTLIDPVTGINANTSVLPSGLGAIDSFTLTNTTPSGGFPSFDNIVISVVPEPASLSLIALAGAAMVVRRRR